MSAIVITQLREVIEALDRRVPCVERASEQGIARDSALLRQQAQARLTQLELEGDCS